MWKNWHILGFYTICYYFTAGTVSIILLIRSNPWRSWLTPKFRIRSHPDRIHNPDVDMWENLYFKKLQHYRWNIARTFSCLLFPLIVLLIWPVYARTFSAHCLSPHPPSALDLNSGLTAALGLNLDDTDHPIVIWPPNPQASTNLSIFRLVYYSWMMRLQ